MSGRWQAAKSRMSPKPSPWYPGQSGGWNSQHLLSPSKNPAGSGRRSRSPNPGTQPRITPMGEDPAVGLHCAQIHTLLWLLVLRVWHPLAASPLGKAPGVQQLLCGQPVSMAPSGRNPGGPLCPHPSRVSPSHSKPSLPEGVSSASRSMSMLASGERSVFSVHSSAGSRLRMCRGAPLAPGHPSGRGLAGTEQGGQRYLVGGGEQVSGCHSHHPLTQGSPRPATPH